MTWMPERRLACRAVRAAGSRLRQAVGSPKVLTSIERDIKLQADLEMDSLIREVLDPSGYPLLSEEAPPEVFNQEAPYWVVDPLDGSFNHSRGIPLCCMSVALVENQTPCLGVVYDYIRDELFWGIPGECACRNESPMSVSTSVDSRSAVLATGFPIATDYSDQGLYRYIRRVQAFKKVRLFGSAALSLAWVACGQLDAYYEDSIKLWDVAGGIALVRAAGGRVETEPSGRAPFAYSVAAASTPELLSALRS